MLTTLHLLCTYVLLSDFYTNLLKKDNIRIFSALNENSTCKFIDKPIIGVFIGCKWIYFIKLKENCTIDRQKARLVAQGYKHEYRVDYEENFAPVAKMTNVQTLLVVASMKGYTLHQMDVKNVFLHGDLEEVVFMKPPPKCFLPR